MKKAKPKSSKPLSSRESDEEDLGPLLNANFMLEVTHEIWRRDILRRIEALEAKLLPKKK
jgi:hypothetical protein